MAQADGSIIIDTKIDNSGFEKGTKEFEKSAKSRAAKLAAEYRKQGMSASEALKRAWAETERDTKKSADAISKSTGEVIGDLGGLKSVASKLASAIGFAFSARAILGFSKDAIKLGSDLQEVQNVVDVTFSTMNAQADKFAKNAAKTAGLSETMAKRYVGTYGAMAKAFGFTEDAAFDMSTALTQLAGDVASFYNITQDEAYTKLKSVFTGETETLKDLGVVMTQAALDQYAIEKGIGKTTRSMTEQEKVALRYRFVMDQLTAASGDFVSTSGSWANQTRILTLQFEQLKATIGQGFINALTPALQGINIFIGRLQVLAEAFLRFTERIFGKAGDSVASGMGETSTQLNDAAQGADNLADGLNGVGGAAKKAKRELAGFDELEVLGDVSGGVSGGAGAIGDALGKFSSEVKGTAGGLSGFDTEEFEAKVDAIATIISGSMLALGAILLFSGAHPALGLGLMAAGAVGLAAEAVENWDAIVEGISGTDAAIFAIASASLLALGVLLAFSGAKIPLGIALIAAGAAGLVTVSALNWDTIVEKLRGPIGDIVAFGSVMFLAIGLALAFSGANVPLGLALVGLGTAGLATVTAVNWDYIKDKIMEQWGDIKSYYQTHIAPIFTKQWWMDKFQSIVDAFPASIKAAVNSGISLLNRFIGWVNNALSFDIPSFSIGNTRIFDGFSVSTNIPKIPMLAKGAVLPPNAPFLAMLGDQKSGANLEAPESLIRQIVREESGNRQDEIVELLRAILEATGVYIDGREIARVVTRYQNQEARANG